MHRSEWFSRHTGHLIVVLGTLMLAAYLVAAVVLAKPDHRVVFGDATHHFVQLRSLIFDRDLDFQNEYVRLYRLTRVEGGTEWIFTELTPTGRVRNYMPVGPALVWAPPYALIAFIKSLLARSNRAAPPDGFDFVLQLVPGATGVLAATFGVWLTWRLARRYSGPIEAAAGVLGVWLGTHAIYYTLISPSYSHALSMATSAAFVSHWLTRRNAWSVTQALVSGALAGAAALMRWQDAIFLAVPIYESLRQPAPWRKRVITAAASCVACVAIFSPQMLVWHALYGRWLTVPQGPSFMQWGSPHLVATLVSDNHGLFSWAPVLLLSVIGLVTLCRRHRQIAVPIGFLCLVSWYVNAAAADWWAGEAFGARRFLSLFPLFAVGLAVWLETATSRTIRLSVVGALAIANALLLVQYEAFMKGLTGLAPYPHGWINFTVMRFVVPFRLLRWWLT